jgi:hypothetical protein
MCKCDHGFLCSKMTSSFSLSATALLSSSPGSTTFSSPTFILTSSDAKVYHCNILSMRHFVLATFCPCDILSVRRFVHATNFLRRFVRNILSATLCPRPFVLQRIVLRHFVHATFCPQRFVRDDLSCDILSGHR